MYLRKTDTVYYSKQRAQTDLMCQDFVWKVFQGKRNNSCKDSRVRHVIALGHSHPMTVTGLQILLSSDARKRYYFKEVVVWYSSSVEILG